MGLNQVIFVQICFGVYLTDSDAIAVRFLADDKGAFTSAVGLLFDASPKLGGPRAQVC